MTKRILLVDDDPDIAAGIELLLTAYGYEVSVVNSGTAALEAAGRFRADAVVLDFQLPDMDGGAVFRKLRERSPSLPVVFSSGHLRSLRDAGVSSDEARVFLLTKPYESAELVEAIERVCNVK